jgi:hypothetical protein
VEDDEFTNDFLLNAVRGMDVASEEIRTGSEYIHVSSLIDYCARRESLAWTTRNSGAPIRRANVLPGLRIIWALGRAAEHHVREQFIKARDARGVLGIWECGCGKTKREGLRPKSAKCPTCDSGLSRYKEIPLFDHDAKIVGNPDLLFVRPDNDLVRVVEIKSMNAAEFKELEAPLANHVIQAASYNRLAEINDMGPDAFVTIFYVCKDFNMKPYKSFTVPITPQIIALLDAMFEAAQERADWVADTESGANVALPPRLGFCTSVQSPRAKKCPECVGCFANPS